jgi:hypothetical protein
MYRKQAISGIFVFLGLFQLKMTENEGLRNNIGN